MSNIEIGDEVIFTSVTPGGHFSNNSVYKVVKVVENTIYVNSNFGKTEEIISSKYKLYKTAKQIQFEKEMKELINE